MRYQYFQNLQRGLIVCCLFVVAACSQGEQSNTAPPSSGEKIEEEVSTKPVGPIGVTTEQILNWPSAPQEWLSYGGNYDETRHSRLDQINKNTISNLTPAWTYDLRTQRGVEATPLISDGIMYVTGAWSIVYAINAKTGEEEWVHDPQVPRAKAVDGCCDVVNRGVALFGDKVFVGTFDGRLQALDAKTGELIWSVITVDITKPYTITGAPRAANGKVFIGNSGSEFGVRGYISAYDAETGDLVWRFYTTPNPSKQPDGAASDEILSSLANATWGDTGAWKTDGGGGTVWDAIVFDSENNNLIFGVGNGSPWNVNLRDPDGQGDNLFISSIVAVDADSGAYKWHYQTTPRDQWDYTATQSLIITELPVGENDSNRRVVMQAPKNGFYYVLDAKTGEFISGEAFVPQNWAEGLDENGRPIVKPAARDTENGALMLPGSHGAHNWHPMAYNPNSGLAYIPSHMIPLFLKNPKPGVSTSRSQFNHGYDLDSVTPSDVTPELLKAISSENEGFLTAWNPTKQELAWRKPLETRSNSGVLSTAAGLIFQGNILGEFRAYDATTGDEIWKTDLNGGLKAAPSTFEIDGEQYIAVATGWGGAYAFAFAGIDLGENGPLAPAVGRVVVFKLGGQATIPDMVTSVIEPTPKAERFGDLAQFSRGKDHYIANCLACHGPFAASGGVLPDLRWSYVTADPEVWKEVVIDGILEENGMVSFEDYLTVEDAEAIRAYVIKQAHDLKQTSTE